MPWRKTKDPYKIWVSEIMLQQTQIARAAPFYNRWIEKFPSIKSVARAPEDKILKMWAGLGYYRRATNFHKACAFLFKEHHAKFPTSIAAFRELPGVGDYISSAVFSIAFNEPIPVYDVNVNRVASRLFELNTTRLASKKKAISLLSKMVTESKNARDFNQAIMDFGRTVCTINSPKCHNCIISKKCQGFINSNIMKFPIIKKKPQKPHYRVVVAFIWKKGKILVNKRPPEKMLGGMWEFPGGKIKTNETPEEALHREIMEEFSILINIEKPVDRFTHTYSHFSIDIEGYKCKYVSGKISQESNMPYKWLHPHQLSSLPFPSASEKFFNKLI